MPRLIELVRALPEAPGLPGAAAQLEISGLASDSRQVMPGWLFAALKGARSDGADFIPEAKRRGAVALLCGVDTPDHGLPAVRTENIAAALAHAAAAFYGRQPAHVVAVTGTDGKTSTADFFRQIAHAAGKKSASVGTLGVLDGGGALLYPGTHTTPDAVALQRILSEIKADYLCMEASSHGLDQHRLDGARLDAAAFTHITRDHLDYHGTQSAYLAAKLRLFSELLPQGKTAVLNADDAAFPALRDVCVKRGHRILGFGREGEDLRLVGLEMHEAGQTARLALLGQAHTLSIPLVGAFQSMNLLAALGLWLGAGGSMEEALAAIPRLQGVPGRLELAARLDKGANVFVDYAHTPAALANILTTLRSHTRRKLHVVFGCGGDRDAGKRPLMGAAAKLADRVIVTDDNPRSEDPAAIRRVILAECPGAIEIADRRRAIYAALGALEAGDVLVIAGKGHEKTQTVGDKTYPFDDAQVAREGARELTL